MTNGFIRKKNLKKWKKGGKMIIDLSVIEIMELYIYLSLLKTLPNGLSENGKGNLELLLSKISGIASQNEVKV